MMIPQLLTPQLSRNATPAATRPLVPSLAFCLIGLLNVLACNGTIDNNEQRSSLMPSAASGSNTGSAAGNAGAAAPGARAPVTSAGGGEDTDNIRGLDSESSADSTRRGGSRRRAADRDRDDEEEERDAGVELVGDAGVPDDAGVIDAGLIDGGLVDGVSADAGTVP